MSYDGSLSIHNKDHWAMVTNKTVTGLDVNPNNAMTSSAVFACVRVLSFNLAQLPLIVYRRLPRGKERAIDHPVYSLLHDRPNPDLSSFHWRAIMMTHTLLYGNGYSEIEFDAKGLPIALWLIPTWRCRPVQIDFKGKRQLIYEVDTGNKSILVPPYQMLHIKGLSTDGMSGLSIIKQAAQAIGVSLAAQEFAGRFFGQGMNIGGVLEHPGKLSEAAYARLRNSIDEAYSGLSKAHRIMLLEEGMKMSKTAIPPEDAQFLESRQFQVVDIARMFGVPPHKIADLTRATFSNIEHQSIEFVQDTIMPWVVNWEQELNYKLLDRGHYVNFLVEGLLRGDSTSRAEFYKALFGMAALSPNDIREKENMNPVEHGDTYFVPLNMIPINALPQPVPETIVETIELTGKEVNGSKIKPEKIEYRAKPNLTILRYKTARAYRAVFEDASRRIVEREIQNIRRAVKKYLSDRSIDIFRIWLRDFYRDFAEYIERQILPPLNTLADAIIPILEEQLERETNANIQEFTREYVKAFIGRYSSSSQGQIEALLDSEDLIDEIEGRLAEWETKRPGRISMNETVQFSNAVALTFFMGAGVLQEVWCNTSGRPCPYCQELDGKVIAIGEDFVKDFVFAEGEDTLKIWRPAMHPPLHLGCECQIEPQ